MAASASRGGSPAAAAAPSSSRNGAPMATSTLPGTRPAGAASTAGTASGSIVVRSRRAAPSCGGRIGCSARAALRCIRVGRFAAAFFERGMPLLEIGQLAGGEATPHSSGCRRRPLASTTPSLRAAALPPSSARRWRMPAVMRLERGALKRSREPPPAVVEPDCISRRHGAASSAARGQKAFGIHYAPTNPDYRGPKARCRRRSCSPTAARPA